MSLLNTFRKKGAIINLAYVTVIIMLIAGLSSCGTKNMKADSLKNNKIRITDIEYDSYPDKSMLVIKASDVLKYTVYKLSNPMKLNIELYGTEVSFNAKDKLKSISDKAVSEIQISNGADNKKTNLVISLAKSVDYNVSPNGNTLSIEFKREIDDMITLKKDTVEKADSVFKNKKFDVVDAKDADIRENTVRLVSSSEKKVIKTAAYKKEDRFDADSNQYARIEALSIDDTLDGLNVRIAGKGDLNDYATLELSEPTRLILDIWDVKNEIKEDSIIVASNSIDTIDIVEQKSKVRFVFNTKKSRLPVYDLNADTNNIIVAFKDAGEGAESIEKASAKSSEKLVVTGFDFEYKEATSKVIFSTNNQADYEVKEDVEGKIIINFNNVRIPKKLSRPLDTSAFASNITYIEPKKSGDGVSLEISLKETTPFNVIQDENKVYIEVENPFEVVEKVKTVVVEKKVPVIKRVVKKKVVPKVKEEELKDVPISAREEKRLLLQEIRDAYESIENIGEDEAKEKKVFSGKRMSMDFKDADIHNVLRLIAEVSGFNVVTSDDVKGEVSIHLSNVPWDQALDVILSVKDLGMVKEDNIILVIPQGKIQAAEERRKARLKALKEEKLNEIKRKQKDIEELRPVVLRVVPVNYASAEELSVQIQPILSEKGTVTVDVRTNVLIIKDLEENIEEAEEMVTKLDTITPQVLIEARIVEASTNFTRRLGVSWGSRYTADAARGNALPYDFPNSVGVGGGMGGPNSNYFVNLPAAGETGAIDFTFGHIANTLSLDMRLSAMETSGEGKIISSPRILTLDNTEARIEQGTSIPYESTSEGGTETEFVDANLTLQVTPHVTSDGRIRLSVKASKNAPNLSIISNGQPAIDKKEAQTELLIRDGDTTVIGGIFVIDETEGTSGVPFFSKLPFIGWMFKTESKVKSRSELLIFITPRIVKDKKRVNL